MTVIDFHPDDLLDREQRGVLTQAERVRLDAHLAGCSACRVERMMRADFAADAEHVRVGSGLSSFVTAALHAARSDEARPTPRPARRGLLGAAAVALLLGVSAAAAARTGWVEQALAAVGIELPSPSRPPARARAPRGQRHGQGAAAELAAPARPPETPPASAQPEAQLPVLPVQPSAARSRPRVRPPSAPRAQPVATVAEAPVEAAALAPATQVAPEPRATPTAQLPADLARSVPVESPSSLFARAARLRREGDRSAALDAYQELTQRFPASAEALRAHALVGRTLLDAGRAREALSAYDAYLTGGDVALREDALAGRARALALLGRDDAARAGFDTLLREFPHTAYARWAERRSSGD